MTVNPICLLSLQIITIFNLFITYGDAFLVSATTYDELYYEIIRMHAIFDDLHSLGEYEMICGNQ